MNRSIEETPQALVENGKIHLGVFRTPFRKMNGLDADTFGGPGMRWLRRLRYKEWIHYGIIHPDWYFGMVILDAKYTAQSFFLAYNRTTRKTFRHSQMIFDRNVRLAETLWDDRSYFRHGKYRMEFQNHLDAGEHRITIEIGASGGQPAVSAEITLGEDLSRIDPLIVSLPLGPNRNMFSHKAPTTASGIVRIGNDVAQLDEKRDLGIMDEHKAYYPYHTWWKWATFAGRDDQGRIVGINLTDNLVKDADRWNENAIWIDGKIQLLGAAEFEIDKSDYMKPWKMRERNGRAELEFLPDGDKTENKNLGLLRTFYHQPYGKFRGFFIDDSGTKHPVNDYYGVTEFMDSYF